MLRAAARLSPRELVFVVFPWRSRHDIRGAQFVLPASLRRATSIELDTLLLRVKPPPPGGDLPALERLSLAGKIVGISDFLDRCPRLRELSVTFRAVSLAAVEAELATIQARRGLAVSLIGIEHITVGKRRLHEDNRRLSPLLRAAARLSPQELVFRHCSCTSPDLPCFPEATSIELSLYGAHLSLPPAGEFSALETLTIWCCSSSLATIVSRCPRLRVLRVINSSTDGSIRISSASLQELDVIARDYGNAGRSWYYIDIVTPVLRTLKLNLRANEDMSVSISAPMLDKVSWCQFYTDRALVFGSWRLGQTNLETVESSSGEDNSGCSLLHVLRLDMSAECYSGGIEINFEQQMKQLPFTDFSALELHLTTRGHVFRAFVLRLLEMHHFQAATRLKVVLVATSQVTRACPENCCHSDEPKNLGSQSILLTHLEEVEIDGFEGGDRELDFLTHIIRCAPMLKRMTVKLSPEHHGGCTTKIYSIMLAYPSVSCYVYRNSGELVPHTCIQSA